MVARVRLDRVGLPMLVQQAQSVPMVLAVSLVQEPPDWELLTVQGTSELPAALAREKALAHAVADAGFELVSEREADEEENIGWLGIFRRVADK